MKTEKVFRYFPWAGECRADFSVALKHSFTVEPPLSGHSHLGGQVFKSDSEIILSIIL